MIWLHLSATIHFNMTRERWLHSFFYKHMKYLAWAFAKHILCLFFTTKAFMCYVLNFFETKASMCLFSQVNYVEKSLFLAKLCLWCAYFFSSKASCAMCLIFFKKKPSCAYSVKWITLEKAMFWPNCACDVLIFFDKSLHVLCA